ncbi:predicted protein, partial [Nematostella vectensis]
MPDLYGEGYGLITNLLHGNYEALIDHSFARHINNSHIAIILMCMLLIGFKSISAALTTGAGGNGGIFAPSLMIGGLVGFVFSYIVNLFAFIQLRTENFIVAAMAGVLAGVMHAPLTAIFLLAEITGGYTLFIPLMIVTAISYFITRKYVRHSIYHKALVEKRSISSCDEEAVTNSSDPIKLLFNFEEGSTYKYLVKSNIEIKPQIGDKDITINQDMTIACKYQKLSNSGTSSNMSVTYDRIIMSSGNNQNTLEFDSDNDSGEGKVFQSIRDVIKKPFEMVISPYGNVLSASGIEDPKNKGHYFSDTAFQKVMQQAFQIYPKKIIAAGDLWERKFSSSIGFIHVTISNNYKL